MLASPYSHPRPAITEHQSITMPLPITLWRQLVRDALVLLLTLKTRRESTLLRLLVGGPLLIAVWYATGGSLFEAFSVLLVGFVLALVWGFALVLVTSAILVQDADARAPDAQGHVSVKNDQPDPRTATNVSSAERGSRTLQSFAVPAELPEAPTQQGEKIRLPLRG
jgi:hypothetical protein